MSIKAKAPVTSAHCDSCRSTTEPTEIRRMDGIEVRICVQPSPCRRRAEAAGIWKEAHR